MNKFISVRVAPLPDKCAHRTTLSYRSAPPITDKGRGFVGGNLIFSGASVPEVNRALRAVVYILELLRRYPEHIHQTLCNNSEASSKTMVL